jgi:hypothetical protein
MNAMWRSMTGAPRIRVDNDHEPAGYRAAFDRDFSDDGLIRPIRPHLRPWLALGLLALRLVCDDRSATRGWHDARCAAAEQRGWFSRTARLRSGAA